MNIDWQLFSNIASALSSMAVVLGVPIGLFQYYQTTDRDHREREYAAFDETSQAYDEFLKFCFEHPKLNIFDIPDQEPFTLTPEEQKQELVAFTILISLFERAYFIYQKAPSAVITRQWVGWSEYITDYCHRKNFRNAWTITGKQFDFQFQKYMEETMALIPVEAESHQKTRKTA